METEFTHTDILAFEQRYRATFINSLGGFKSLALIGTKSKLGQTNLAVFNSLFHVGANPPLFGFIVRPDSVERHTLSNILETGVLTVNQVHEGIYENAHQTAARYPREVSEFNAARLTEEYKHGFYAPYVLESRIKIAASLIQKTDIAENGTILILAKIESVTLPSACIGTDGFIDLEKAGTITCQGLDSYHTTTRLNRLTYAKPDSWPKPM
jgi:flavin reductase (DIM6/NTAB) family NADH-FMN oxidoreductase RutF